MPHTMYTTVAIWWDSSSAGKECIHPPLQGSIANSSVGGWSDLYCVGCAEPLDSKCTSKHGGHVFYRHRVLHHKPFRRQSYI